MNREIKFRIWADNKFYNKCLVGNTNNTNDEKWTCPMVWLEKQKEWVHCDNGIICQYTGLHDENGKEIYEGDIIEFSYDEFTGNFDTKVAKGTIEFTSGGAFCIKPFEIEGRKVKDTYNEEWFLLYTVNTDTLEVIGNIYDNPELLGGEENGDKKLHNNNKCE